MPTVKTVGNRLYLTLFRLTLGLGVLVTLGSVVAVPLVHEQTKPKSIQVEEGRVYLRDIHGRRFSVAPERAEEAASRPGLRLETAEDRLAQEQAQEQRHRESLYTIPGVAFAGWLPLAVVVLLGRWLRWMVSPESAPAS